MVGQNLKTRSVIGVGCQSADGAVWTWNAGGKFYRWCKLGFLELVEGMTVTRVMISRKLEGAVGYSLGYSHGFAKGRGVDHLDPATVGRLETKPADALQPVRAGQE